MISNFVGRMNWSDLHEKQEIGPIAAPLAALSFLYGMGVRLRVKAREKMKRSTLPGFVVSVGNLGAGGTGKTPATIMIARWAMEQGFRVAVLSRGYGGRYRKDVLEVSDGKSILAGPSEAGDEPVLMASRLDGVPVILSRKRFLAGLYAHRKFKTGFFVLDDGFQHMGLARDLDLVLLDAKSPFGNGHLLPRGPLREPLSHLARASAFLITRCDERSSGKSVADFLGRRFPSRPVFRSAHVPDRIVFTGTGESYDPAFLRGKRVLAFSGIARPDSFRDTLTGIGAELRGFRRFGDHHRFTPSEIRNLSALRTSCGADLLVTTEKDAQRLDQAERSLPHMAFLSVSLSMAPEKEGFFEFVKAGVQKRQAIGS